MTSNYQDDFMSLYLNIKMITGHREHHAPARCIETGEHRYCGPQSTCRCSKCRRV